MLIVVFFASQVECKFKAPSIYCSTTAIGKVKKSQDVHVFLSCTCLCVLNMVHCYSKR